MSQEKKPRQTKKKKALADALQPALPLELNVNPVTEVIKAVTPAHSAPKVGEAVRDHVPVKTHRFNPRTIIDDIKDIQERLLVVEKALGILGK